MSAELLDKESGDERAPYRRPPEPDDVSHLPMLRPSDVLDELNAECAFQASSLRAFAVYHGAAGTCFDRMQRRLKAIEQARTTFEIVQENRDEFQKIVARRQASGRRA